MNLLCKILGAVALALGLACCGQLWISVSHDYTLTYVIVGNENTLNVTVFSVDPGTGNLTEVAGSPFSVGSQVWGIAALPSQRLIFTHNISATIGVSGFSMNPYTGYLTPLANSPYALPSGTDGQLTIDPQGQFLFVSQQNTDGLSIFSINSATGVPTLINTLTAATQPSMPRLPLEFESADWGCLS